MGAGTALPLAPMEMAIARAQIKQSFPKIADRFVITSAETDEYNCIAWAAHDTEDWWWPNPADRYWPAGVEATETIEAFSKAFATVGFERCTDGLLIPGIEKIALYTIGASPKHMARQLSSGRWTSKLGKSWDIMHVQPEDVSGDLYGDPTVFFARLRPLTPKAQ